MAFSHRPFLHTHESLIDSTQEYAKRELERLDPAKIYLFTADEQHSGRGTFGKPWHGLSKKNFYGTFVFSCDLEMNLIQNIPQILSLSVCNCFNGISTLCIKWPNDLMIENKKIGGILTETRRLANHLWLIVGLGINFSADSCNTISIDQPFTTLDATPFLHINKVEFSKQLPPLFFSSLDLLKKEGFSYFFEEYRKKMVFLEMPVYQNQCYVGLSSGIHPSGHLNVFTPDHLIKTIHTGSIKSYV